MNVKSYRTFGLFKWHCSYSHSFKNRTGPVGPTGSTGNRHQIRSGYYKKPKITKKTVNSKNRPVQPENQKNRRLNRLMPGLRFVDFAPKTTSFWSLKTNPKPNLITLSSLTPHSASQASLSHSTQFISIKSQALSASLCFLSHPSRPHLSLALCLGTQARTAARRHAPRHARTAALYLTPSPFELCSLLIR